MNSLLVVDDEPSVRSIISRWGASHGYSVAEADSAVAALEQMQQHPADIALCDLNMPDHDGRWLAARLQKQFPETAVVMTTGGHPQDSASGVAAGAVACLMKPFTFAELARTLQLARDWQIEHATARV
jgi:CheY-like chemotaxis protein